MTISKNTPKKYKGLTKKQVLCELRGHDWVYKMNEIARDRRSSTTMALTFKLSKKCEKCRLKRVVEHLK